VELGDGQLSLGATKARRVDSTKSIGQPCDVSVATVAGAVEYQQLAVEQMFGVSLFPIRCIRPHGSLCRWSDDGDRLVNTGYAGGGDDCCSGDGQVFCDLPSGTTRRAPQVTVSLFSPFSVRKRWWQVPAPMAGGGDDDDERRRLVEGGCLRRRRL